MIAIVAAVAVVAVAAAGGIFYLYSQEDGPRSGRQGADLNATAKQYGVDEVRTPPPAGDQTGNGGEYGEALLDALTSAGFQCTRLDGSGQSAQQICYRQEREPYPTIQSVGISILEDEVIRIRSNVELDPAWSAVVSEPDVRPVAHSTFDALIQATIPDGERPTASQILSRAGEGEDSDDPDDSGHARADIASGRLDVTIGRTGGQFILERKGPEGTVYVDHGLDYVTPKELQTVAEDHGLRCTREDASLTCTGENEIEMKVEFPVPVSGTQFVSDVEVSSPRKPGTITLAQDVAQLVAGKYGQEEDAQEWIAGCFGVHSDRTSYAHSEFGCEPGLEGSADDPEVFGYWFFITRITGT